MKTSDKEVAFEELSHQELLDINGGETLWYWGGYVVGRAYRFVEGALENPPNLPSASVYK